MLYGHFLIHHVKITDHITDNDFYRFFLDKNEAKYFSVNERSMVKYKFEKNTTFALSACFVIVLPLQNRMVSAILFRI